MNKEDDIFGIIGIAEIPSHLLTKSNVNFSFIRPEINFRYHVLKSLRSYIRFKMVCLR